ncbi:hypothetical protein ACFLIM_41430 [Nonomuraea sp. M3C6]|uniref:Uncharacterized protein n=1 Tax=Nonomuraea marmarensis TaxID=3351344 RepID=A0ABW7ARI7_9ACTN
MYLTKLVVFGAAAVPTSTSTAIGLALAPASAAGAWAGRKIVDGLPAHVFVLVVEARLMLIVSGLLLGHHRRLSPSAHEGVLQFAASGFGGLRRG